MGVVAQRYSTAVRNKTNIRCVHGPIATSPAEQVNTFCIDSKVGLGVVAKGLCRCCLESAAAQIGEFQLSLCLEIGEISDENYGTKIGSCNIELLLERIAQARTQYHRSVETSNSDPIFS
jgi:hypothetical protein